jgi:hypothetical protein
MTHFRIGSMRQQMFEELCWNADSPRTPIKRYTEILHTVCKGNIPSFPCKMRHSQSVSTTETEER